MTQKDTKEWTDQLDRLKGEFLSRFMITDDDTGIFRGYAERSDGVTISDWWLAELEKAQQEAVAEYKKSLLNEIKELELNFSSVTGAINSKVAFGSNSEKEVESYNEALKEVKSLIED